MAKTTVVYDNDKNNFKTRLQGILWSENYFDVFKLHIQGKLHSAKTQEDIDRYYYKLADLEKRTNLIQDDIAFITDKDKSSVTRWLNGPSVPDVVSATRIAGAFGITTDYLLGVANTPNLEVEETYKVFEKYGIDPQAFQNLDNLYKETTSPRADEWSIINYKKTVAGLNLLLTQHTDNTHMDILRRIGYFLTQSRFDAYYYFDSDDVDELFDGLFESIDAQKGFNQEFVKKCLNDFLSNSPRFSASHSTLVSLDTIRDRLKEYKMLLDPDFFNEDVPDDARFFKPKETNTPAE